jgi:hypothetical protein
VRRVYVALVALGVVLFFAVSALLARVWSADGAEGSAVTALIRAEAGGDQQGMLDRIQGCRASAACRARVQANASALRRPGKLLILQNQASTGFSFVGTTGSARVAWKTPSSIPVVQCVRVRRAGNAISGLKIELLTISQRIKNDADCPPRF